LVDPDLFGDALDASEGQVALSALQAAHVGAMRSVWRARGLLGFRA
jgi:hypothetical protein